ncbi:transcriptional regulator [archaeon CG10_big_fil_rev_8_21_14_0_10_43_11]|nr:MAG: transcriptional regulator [archaeon CG10_big_fil_rev_8_21_14_0_10_43_11]
MERLPQEIEVWYIIPELRKEFAVGMRRSGMKQKDIASLLGLTGAAVSQYISQKRAGKITFCARVKQEIKESVPRITKEATSANEEIQRILTLMRNDKHLCETHKLLDPSIDKDCSICFS